MSRVTRVGFYGAWLAAVCMGVGTLRADDWPTFRHDVARSGTTTEVIPLPLSLQWQYSPAGKLRQAWAEADRRVVEGKELRDRLQYDNAIEVAIVENRIFLGSPIDHQIYCFDLESGRTIWSFYTGGPVRLAPTVAKGRVFVGSDDGFAYCLDANNGRLIWKQRLGPADESILARGEMISRWPVRTGILVDDNIAYFGAGVFPHENVYLAAVDAQTGEFIWKDEQLSHLDAGRDDLSPQGYLLASSKFLYVPSGRSRPRSFLRATGKPQGSPVTTLAIRSTTVAGTSALIADDRLTVHSLGSQVTVIGDELYAVNGLQVMRLKRKEFTAAVARRAKWAFQIRSLTTKIRSDRSKADEYKQEIAKIQQQINASKEDGVVWRVPCRADGALIVTGSHLFVADHNQVLAFAKQDGSKTWTGAVQGDVQGLAAAQGCLVASTSDGSVFVFGANKQATAESAQPARRRDNPYPDDQWTEIYRKAAAEILQATGVTRGYCYVVGAEEGRLALELAKRSRLKIYGIESDAAKVAAARKALTAAGYYGHRVTILQGDPNRSPFANYFANLIASDSMIRSGKLPSDAGEVLRHQKPFGGVVCWGPLQAASGGVESPISAESIERWSAEEETARLGGWKRSGRWLTLRRGALPGSANWSHQYADPGNTANSGDKLVQGGLGVLWYGDPGPDQMVNRHQGAVGPLVVDGRMFVQGTDHLMAYDVYNGLLLWKQENSKAVRTGVFQNNAPGNLAAGKDSVFHMVRDEVIEHDAATGEIRATHKLPPSVDAKTHEWGYVAYRDGILFGTATEREVIERARRRRGQPGPANTDTIFAIDVDTGKHLWAYQGGSIEFQTIALGPGRVFFVDSSVTSEQRAALLREDKTELKGLKGEAAKKAEERMKKIDVRLAVALDARSGKKLWSKPVDVTDCSEIGIGGGKLTLIYHDDALLFCGANANGHYWRQFVAGEFKQRRLVALSAKTGYRLWAKDANYRHRPIIVGSRVIAEPWAFDLKTGKQLMRQHPITGNETPWSIMRPGHHCGMLTASDNMLIFRSGSTGFYDLQADAGTRHFAGHRLGCWINAVPANGLVVIPEASAGCVCMFSIASTIVLEPRRPRRPWSLVSATGPSLPVRRLSLNFGAPGDRRARDGTLWLAYPRQIPRRGLETSLDLKLELPTNFLPRGAFYSEPDNDAISGDSDWTWIACSGARGLSRLVIPLRDDSSGPARYSVRLIFSPSPTDRPGQRLFDIKLQGKIVAEGFDAAAKPDQTVLIHEATGVSVPRELVVEIVPRNAKPSPEEMPILSAIDIRVEHGK